jgi:hypothetical protein
MQQYLCLTELCLPVYLMRTFAHAAACPAEQPSRVLVLDDVQQLLAAAEGPLPSLLALREQVRQQQDTLYMAVISWAAQITFVQHVASMHVFSKSLLLALHHWHPCTCPNLYTALRTVCAAASAAAPQAGADVSLVLFSRAQPSAIGLLGLLCQASNICCVLLLLLLPVCVLSVRLAPMCRWCLLAVRSRLPWACWGSCQALWHWPSLPTPKHS